MKRKMTFFDHVACMILGTAAIGGVLFLTKLWVDAMHDHPLATFAPFLMPAAYLAGRGIKYLIGRSAHTLWR